MLINQRFIKLLVNMKLDITIEEKRNKNLLISKSF
jgi:hypothetical protein